MASSKMRRVMVLMGALVAMLLSAPVCAQDVTAKQKPAGTKDSGQPQGQVIHVDVNALRTKVPLAIPATTQPGGSTGGVAAKVHEILERDMKLAGFFKILPNDGFFFDPSKEGMGASSIKFENWLNVGANGLIKSAARTTGDKVVLDLRLYLVVQGQQASLKWTGGAVSKDDYAKKVHAFANAVLEFYTGKPGMFGSRIAYVRRKGHSKQVYVMQMGDNTAHQITHNNSINILPSFGPGAIYYTSYRRGNPDLWAYKGGKAHRLSKVPGQNTGAAYCGGKLAVTLSKGGENTDIYLIDPDSGKIVQRLTNHWAIDTSPTWSPDCSKIAFVSGRSGGPQIYLMNADGSNQHRLTYEGKYNTQPTWSPKGDVIAFSARDERNAFDIFTVDLQGNIERLTQDQGNNSDPSFSPDGRYLVFVSDRGGKGKRLWVMTANGLVQNPLSAGSKCQSPAWEH